MPTIMNMHRVDTVNNLIDSYKDKLDSPYNIHFNRAPIPVEWYNQSKEHTSMDEGTRDVWDTVGAESPVRYNLIDGVVYGMPQLNINWSRTDNGLESDDISGDTYILPNTWIPYPNDYFRVKHIDRDVLFTVTDVTVDTFPNGANYYKVNFTFDRQTAEQLNKQVIAKFRMILDNVGTEYDVIIKEDIFATADRLDSIYLTLQAYYLSCFFKDSLQNFVYTYDNCQFYDPFMIEFFKRNELFNNSGGFVYINHELPLSATFSIDYSRSLYHWIELRDKNKQFFNRAVAKLIDNSSSIFYARTGDFYEVMFSNLQFAKSIDIIDGDLIYRIQNNDPSYDGSQLYKNIIVRYFNNQDYTDEELQALEFLQIEDSKDCFYYIPIIMYCLRYKISDMIKRR